MAPSPIKDLAIVPSEGSTTLLHGYLGLTPTITISGLVTFSTAKQLALTHVHVSFLGDVTVALALLDGPRKASHVLVPKSSKILFDATTGSSGSTSPTTPPASPLKKPKGVKVDAGSHSYPFEFVIPAERVAELPASMTTSWNHLVNSSLTDSVNIRYYLEAEVGVAPGLFGSGIKLETVTEDVDVPRINVPDLLRSLTTNPAENAVSLIGSNERLEWDVSIDRAIFGIGDPVKFVINYIRTMPNTNTTIQGVTVAIRQDATITAEGQIKIVRDVVSHPETKGRFVSEALKSGSAGGAAVVQWKGEVVGGIQSSHVHEGKGRRHKAIDTFQAVEIAGVVAIRHWFEINVKLKGEADFKIEGPATFVDADKDTKDWVIRNVSSIAEE